MKSKMSFMRIMVVTILPLGIALSAAAEPNEIRDQGGNYRSHDQDGNPGRWNGEHSRSNLSAQPDSRVSRNIDKSRGMMRDSIEESNTVIINDSLEAYRALTKQSGRIIPDSVVSRAQCLAIVPNVITAAAVVGGSHGDGIATCKLSDGKWSAPAFVDLNVGSVGAQLGAKSTDVVMYFTSPAAVAALKRGKFGLGADASVVAGSFEREFDTSGAGVIAYQRSSGAFLGASLNGGHLASDDDANRAYYGKNTTAATILEGREMAMNRHSDIFQGVLP